MTLRFQNASYEENFTVVWICMVVIVEGVFILSVIIFIILVIIYVLKSTCVMMTCVIYLFVTVV